jgi:gliding motility-associated-like protein
VVTGITNPAATGSNNIREILFNPTTGPITVTYTYSLVSGGCFGTVDVTLRVNPNRTTLFPGAISGTQAVCIGTAATAFVSLSPASGGNGTINYRWQSSLDNSTFTDIPGATALTYAAGALSQSTYFRRVAVSGDQEFATNVVLVTVNKAIPPSVTPAGPLFLVTGGSFTLTSTTAVAYIWSNSATTQSITVTAPGGYRVTITDANGCKDTSNLVAVSPPPPLTVNATYIIGNPNNPPNSGAQVTGLPGAQLKYYLLSAGGTVIPVPALPSSPGTYTYYVSQVINGYESIRVPYTVTMIEPFKISDPQKVLSAKPEMQPDGSFIIRFSVYVNNSLTVLLDSVRMKDDLTKVFPSVTQFELLSLKASGNLVANQQYNGSSNIELLADGSKLNAGAKDSINLVIRLVPNGFFGILKNTATLTAKTPYGTLTVNSNDPSIGTGVGNREPTPFEIPGVEIFVPGGFSPNQDGINDYLVIRRPSTTTLQLEIFNRWGNPVYRSSDYKNDWNGRTNQPGNVLGPEIPDGTYYYIVTGTDRISGKITRLNGFITVKR